MTRASRPRDASGRFLPDLRRGDERRTPNPDEWYGPPGPLSDRDLRWAGHAAFIGACAILLTLAWWLATLR